MEKPGGGLEILKKYEDKPLLREAAKVSGNVCRNALCSVYAAVTLAIIPAHRHPAHLVSAPILHRRYTDTRCLVTNYETEMYVSHSTSGP